MPKGGSYSFADAVHVIDVCGGGGGTGGQGKAVYTSSDAGRSWTLRASNYPPAPEIGSVPIGGYVGVVQAVTPEIALLGLNRGALYRSTDAGVTWTPVLGVGESFFVSTAAYGSQAWVAMEPSPYGQVVLYGSADRGDHWTALTSRAGNP